MKEIEIIKDDMGRDIVKINNIIFRGKQHIDWDAVELYLKKYIGEFVTVLDEKIRIANDFPDEYAHSIYTAKLKGGIAKAKANGAQGIMEMLKIASHKRDMENKKEKHNRNASGGWRYYVTRFAIPIFDERKSVLTYNIYKATLIVRVSSNGQLYLYDMQEIKKETSTPSRI